MSAVAATPLFALPALAGPPRLSADDIRTVPCPYCRAPAGRRCQRPSGHPAMSSHAARREALIVGALAVITDAELQGYVREPSLPSAYGDHLVDDAAEALAFLEARERGLDVDAAHCAAWAATYGLRSAPPAGR